MIKKAFYFLISLAGIVSSPSAVIAQTITHSPTRTPTPEPTMGPDPDYPIAYCPPTFKCPENITDPNKECEMDRPDGLVHSTLFVDKINNGHIPPQYMPGKYDFIGATSFQQPDPRYPNRIMARCNYQYSLDNNPRSSEKANIGVEPTQHRWFANFFDPKNKWSKQDYDFGKRCEVTDVSPEEKSEECPFFVLK
jgi:hypothetical protein